MTSAMPAYWSDRPHADRATIGQNRRKRGTTLVELVLYISIAALIMTFSIGLMREEQVRSERSTLAAELQQVTTAAQTYVSANYENIRDHLLNDTAAGGPLIRVYSMNAPVAQGYLPAIFAQGGSAPKSFVGSLQYGIAVRAVLRGDTAVPPATQQRTAALIVAGSDPPRFQPQFVDNRYQVDPVTGTVTNNEIDLEALLITISADPCVIVPAAHGPRIVAQSETNSAGYVTGLGSGQSIPAGCSADVANNLAWTGTGAGTALTATGPYGGWRLPLEPYQGVTLTAAEFPDRDGQVFNNRTAVQAGRFASLLALPNRPPLSESAKIARDGDNALRCNGLPPNSAQELECRQSDQMYADLSFTSWDSNGDGDDDVFPGLADVNRIDMALKLDADGNPVATVGPAQVTNVLSLSCTDDNDAVTSEPGRFKVDCPETQMQGLVVTAAATFASSVAVAGEVSAESAKVDNELVVGVGGTTGKIILNGENMADKLTTRLSHTFSDDDSLQVAKPSCQTGYSPDILVLPVAFETDEDLRGVYTEVTSNTGTWEVDLLVKEERNGQGNDVRTVTNPDDSKVVVLTGCTED